MRKVNVKVKQGFALVFAASMLVSFCVQPGFAQEIEALSDNKKKAVKTGDAKTASKSEYTTAPPPEVETTSSTGKWLLYGGLTAAGVGILAVAIGSSDSGGSSSSATTPAIDPVGPDISGSDWVGTLTITNEGNEGSESVTSVITHSGESVTISTSSSLAYGQYFSGHSNESGYLTVRDSATNKIWTTHKGNDSGTLIQLYDYVNNDTTFDTLFLVR